MNTPIQSEAFGKLGPRGILVVAGVFALLSGVTAYLGWWLACAFARPYMVLALLATLVAIVTSLDAFLREKALEQEDSESFLKRFEGFRHRTVPLIACFTIAGLARVFWGIYGDLFTWTTSGTDLRSSSGAIFLVAAFVIAVISRVIAQAEGSDRRGLSVWARCLSVVAAFGGVAIIVGTYGARWAEQGVSSALLVLLVLLTIEMFLTFIADFFSPRQGVLTLSPPFQSNILGLFFASLNLLDGFVAGLKKQFNVDLRETWVFIFLRRAFLPLLTLQALAFIASTCFVMVAPHEQGVLERWGCPVKDHLLEPGLHIKAPWPIDRVVNLPVKRIESINLGVEGDLNLPYRLWAKKHWDNEYQLLLGDGRELVTFNATVQYRISDPFAWLYGHQNPKLLLEAEAYRAISEEMVARTITEVLTRDRNDFAEVVTRQLQKRMDDVKSGLFIIAVTLNEVHPPVDVAGAYQDVVSAQTEQRTRVLEAQVYTERAIPAAQAEAERMMNVAHAGYAETVNKAEGRSARTMAALASYRAQPNLYRWRRHLEAIERPLSKAKTTILDHRLKQGKDYWIDLRETQ